MEAAEDIDTTQYRNRMYRFEGYIVYLGHMIIKSVMKQAPIYMASRLIDWDYVLGF